MRDNSRKLQKDSRGFTLIELAMVMIISGMVTLALSHMFLMERHKAVQKKTDDSLIMVQSALSEFRAVNGRYPCPASLTDSPSDADYGWEDCGLPPITDGTRDADGDGANDPILIGAVPVKTLLDPDGIPGGNPFPDVDGLDDVPMTDTFSYDGWGRKLTYAVTQRLTDPTTFNELRGVIDVVDENDVPVIPAIGVDPVADPVLYRELQKSAHLILISHGENGVGAYTKEGQQVDDCIDIVIPAPPPVGVVINTVNERENCDPDGKFAAGLRTMAELSYFDDTYGFMRTRSVTHWEYKSGDQVANTNPGNVGWGIDDPTERLHLTGDMKAYITVADEYCDETNTECMPAAVLGGDLPQMECASSNLAVTSIENNSVNCGAAFSSIISGTCPAGEYLVGVTNLGNIICDDLN